MKDGLRIRTEATVFLLGYYNRNRKQELDIPVGPSNQIEPGGPDRGQPAHFLVGRQWGMFAVKVPSDFGESKIFWTIVANGKTTVIPASLKTDYEISPLYNGRIDDNYREELVKTQDARNAIEALLAKQPVAISQTGVFGCSTKWNEKEASRIADLKKIEAEPVPLEMASANDLKKLRANPTGKLLLVSFWATWCGPCLHEFPDLETTYRMYRVRGFEFVTVSTNMPDEKASVMKMLEKQHASSRNLLFGSDDTYALQAAFNPNWTSAVPYTMLISPNGAIVYERQGDIDFLELRRTILANLPAGYIGFQKYWTTK